jgi:CRISPR-associated protein Csm4
MKALTLTLRPLSPFGSALAGDTLFGHLCWALAWRQGSAQLDALLSAYTQGKPYAVLSDAFPAGFVPRPSVPDFAAGLDSAQLPGDRKALKRKRWLPLEQAHLPLAQWLLVPKQPPVTRSATVTQNSINRLTGATGTGLFAPRQVEQTFHALDADLQVYALLDETRLPQDALLQALQDIGLHGFGRDASTGLGKFELRDCAPTQWSCPHSTHAMTLAPCAFDPDTLDPAQTWWQPQTRFGRHGSTAATTGGFGGAFKKPLLLARTGAVLRRPTNAQPWHGRGLGGADHPISAQMPNTVHQGYAPCMPIRLGENQAC